MKFQRLTVTPLPLERFIKDSGLTQEQPTKYFHLLVAQDNESKQLLGYLLYYFMIKTSSGKHLYVEDIFVRETARKTGVGSALIKNAASAAIRTESVGMKLQCLHWNPARQFYESHGGKLNGIVIGDWLEYDFTPDALIKCFQCWLDCSLAAATLWHLFWRQCHWPAFKIAREREKERRVQWMKRNLVDGLIDILSTAGNNRKKRVHTVALSIQCIKSHLLIVMPDDW